MCILVPSYHAYDWVLLTNQTLIEFALDLVYMEVSIEPER